MTGKPLPETDTRATFATAAQSLAAVVSAIRPDQWDRPGLGVWDVRSLVGHTLRAVSTCEEYLAHPADRAGSHSATIRSRW